jgi:hypothetical protein
MPAMGVFRPDDISAGIPRILIRPTNRPPSAPASSQNDLAVPPETVFLACFEECEASMYP